VPIAEPIRARLAELITSVEVNPDPAKAFNLNEPHELSSGSRRSLLFRGVAFEELTQLSFDLAGHALKQGGHSRTAVRELIRAACNRAQDEGANAAIDWLEAQLDQDVREYVVVESVPAIFQRDSLNVGACVLYQRLAEVPLERGDFTIEAAAMDFPGRVIATRVHARDDRSALLIARSRFDEALAVLILADGSQKPVEGKRLYGPVGGPYGHGAGWRGGVVVTADNKGKLFPGFQALSVAVEKPEFERTYWEARTVAATRWYATGVRTAWPAQSLAAHMTALECLFVVSDEPKRSTIASEATKRAVLKGFTVQEQERWLKKLYDNRSSAVHEGREFLEDAKLELLASLVQHMCGWGSVHLVPWHYGDERPCETFAEVVACDERRVTEEQGS
jgi:hypothetical protein